MTKPTVQSANSFNLLAEGLEEISLDVINTHDPVLVSHWYRSGDDLDLHFIIKGEKDLIKQQLCFYGQVVEWNQYEGIKTGYVEEIESATYEKNAEKNTQVMETIRYDFSVNKVSLNQAVDILKSTTQVDAKWLGTILINFGDKVSVGSNSPKSFSFLNLFKKLFRK